MTNSKDREPVVNLREALAGLLDYDSDAIYSREEWGTKLTFHDFKGDFLRLFGLAKIFIDLPFELLPDAQLKSITQVVTNASDHLSNIDSFDAATANNAQETAKTLGAQVKTHADAVTVEMAPWISYLAFQKGDVSNNIANLEGAIAAGERIIEDAKDRIEKEESNIRSIVQKAQDFAGDKGVTIFTKQFDAEAGRNGDEATRWLIATAGVFGLTIVALTLFIYQLQGVEHWPEWVSRGAMIGILVSAGVWCGKNYRILRHQESVNRHKANGLKSFLLFRDAADKDEGTRNAVLLETTRAIFSASDSGFIPSNGSSPSPEIRVIDSTRAAGALQAATKTTRTVSD